MRTELNTQINAKSTLAILLSILRRGVTLENSPAENALGFNPNKNQYWHFPERYVEDQVNGGWKFASNLPPESFGNIKDFINLIKGSLISGQSSEELIDGIIFYSGETAEEKRFRNQEPSLWVHIRRNNFRNQEENIEYFLGVTIAGHESAWSGVEISPSFKVNKEGLFHALQEWWTRNREAVKSGLEDS